MDAKPNGHWPYYDQDEIDEVSAVLRSGRVNYWTGDLCREFERDFAVYTECQYAIAVANGTVALDLALRALELSPGAEVIVTSRTFIASVSSIVNAGLVPVFADVDLDTQNITMESISEVLTSRTEAILCVHLAGWPCDMASICQFAAEHKLRIVEDCAQAHGARHRGRSVGSFGDVAAWSFCQDKIMSTGGEGGMVTTNDTKVWSLAWEYKDHGKSYIEMQSGPTSSFKWVHNSFGTNWRMTEMQAAIGRIQLRKLEGWIRSRNVNGNKILDAARECEIFRVPSLYCNESCSISCDAGCRHAFYKCYVFVNGGAGLRDRVLEAIRARGVRCSNGSCPEVYLEKAFEKCSWRPKIRLANARLLGETSLMFECHPTMTEEQRDLVVNSITEVATQFSHHNVLTSDHK